MYVIITDTPNTLDNIKRIQYPLISKEKQAFAIILNNETFDSLEKRNGSDKDESTIHTLKEKFHGMIVIHECTLKDLKADEITGAFKMLAWHDPESLNDTEIDGAFKLFRGDQERALSPSEKKKDLKYKQIDFTNYSCFMAFIMSHGDECGIAGTDYKKGKNTIKVDTLSSYFTPNKCEGLKNKPKIFFIQACRGTKRDVLPTMDDTSSKPLKESMYVICRFNKGFCLLHNYIRS